MKNLKMKRVLLMLFALVLVVTTRTFAQQVESELKASKHEAPLKIRFPIERIRQLEDYELDRHEV